MGRKRGKLTIPIKFQSVEALTTELRKIDLKSSFTIISLDGKDGVGKSTVAKHLCHQFDLMHIELDNYLDKHQNAYVDFIRYEELDTEVSNAESNSVSIVIEGVCVQQILERIGRKPGIKIYIKRTSEDGMWYDFKYFNSHKTAEEVIEEDKEANRRWRSMMMQNKESLDETDQNFDGLKFEVIRYHYDYKPHETPDYILKLHIG